MGTRDRVTISIVGTNDLHGGVLSEGGRGGLALLDGYVRNLRAVRAQDGGAVLLLDAGDLFQGTMESNLNEGAAVISAYNALHYDAAAIGNHEFDFGPEGAPVSPQSPADDPRGALKARIKQAHFPFLAANIIDKNTGRPVAWENARPSTILTAAGIHVGVVGLTTLETLTATLHANLEGLDVVPLAPALEAEARRLRDQGATIVVAVAHAGGKCTKFDNPADVSSCEPNGEIFKVARALPAGLVDVIVAGHRHEGIAHDVAGIPVISSYMSGRAFGRVDLSVAKATGRAVAHRTFPPHTICVASASAKAIQGTSVGSGECEPGTDGKPEQYEGQPVTASREIEQVLAPAVAAAEAFKNNPLGVVIDGPLNKNDDDESAPGNALADWIRASTGVDVAVLNMGGIRKSVPSGPLTYGRLFELTPFENRRALLTLTGAELTLVVRSDLEHRRSGVILSGARASATCGIGGLHVTLRRESGKPIADPEVLKIATFDFLVTGGDDIFTPVMPFRNPPILEGSMARDEIADWLRRSGRRWSSGDLFDPSHRRIDFPGRRPVRCAEG